MALREINFDGIIGPSHNYAGLSFGNVASMKHGGQVSQPRAAALQPVQDLLALRSGPLGDHEDVAVGKVLCYADQAEILG